MSQAFAVLEGNTVVNTAVADPEFAATQGWVALSNGAGIGWTYDNGVFTPPPTPAPTPAPQPTKDDLLAQLQALQAQINALP